MRVKRDKKCLGACRPAGAKDARPASGPLEPLGRGQDSPSSAPWLRGSLQAGKRTSSSRVKEKGKGGLRHARLTDALRKGVRKVHGRSETSVEIERDASSAIAIGTRRRLGRLRHLDVKWLRLLRSTYYFCCPPKLCVSYSLFLRPRSASAPRPRLCGIPRCPSVVNLAFQYGFYRFEPHSPCQFFNVMLLCPILPMRQSSLHAP